MTKPTHRAFLVETLPEGSDRKPRWTEVGSVWPHKNGAGFDLVIPPGLSVAGRIVCVLPKEDSEQMLNPTGASFGWRRFSTSTTLAPELCRTPTGSLGNAARRF
jgi:hypothetical protein